MRRALLPVAFAGLLVACGGDTGAPPGEVPAAPEAPSSAETALDTLAPPRIELLVDLSSSMLSPVPGTSPPISRYELLLVGLSTYLAALPDGAVVGARVFGLAGCDPSELVRAPTPLGETGRQEILGRLRTLRPQGATPLARAIREAAQDLQGGPWTLLVLSDGGDSCEGPDAVCTAARELVARGARVRIDLVRVFIPPAERAALACAPLATGGRMIDLDQVSTVSLAAMVPVRAIVALLLILLGWATFLGLGDLATESLRRLLPTTYAALLTDLLFFGACVGWAAYWTGPVVHLPAVLRAGLFGVGAVLVVLQLRRRLARGARSAVPDMFFEPGSGLGGR